MCKYDDSGRQERFRKDFDAALNLSATPASARASSGQGGWNVAQLEIAALEQQRFAGVFRQSIGTAFADVQAGRMVSLSYAVTPLVAVIISDSYFYFMRNPFKRRPLR